MKIALKTSCLSFELDMHDRYRRELGDKRLSQWNLQPSFYFRHLLASGTARPKKSLLHLSREVSSLAKGLPLERASSIFLVTDENRMDILR